jgi:Tol biopolymer transport system component
MMNFKVRWLAATVLLAFAACGGGGGGAQDATTPTTPNSKARSGTMAYVHINELFAVDMRNGASRSLSKLVVVGSNNRNFAGATVGPAGEFAVSYNTDTALSNRSWVVILKPDGTQERTISLNFMLNGPPFVSPDGSKIAFDASFYNGNTSQTNKFIQVISRTGENLFYYSNFAYPQWMPDGQLLLTDKDGVHLSTADYKAAPVLIPNSQNFGDFSVSPDGKQIAFVRRATTGAPRHIYMMNIDGSGTRQVTQSATSEETSVQFSPDGKDLMVTTYSCISVFNSYPHGIGNVDEDLIHVIPANSSMLDILDIQNLSDTALQREDGLGRCTSGTLSWR